MSATVAVVLNPGTAIQLVESVAEELTLDSCTSTVFINGMGGLKGTPPTCSRFNPSNTPLGPCTSCPAPKPPNSTSNG